MNFSNSEPTQETAQTPSETVQLPWNTPKLCRIEFEPEGIWYRDGDGLSNLC